MSKRKGKDADDAGTAGTAVAKRDQAKKPKQPCPCGCGTMLDPEFLDRWKVTSVSIGVDGREIATFASLEEFDAFMDALKAVDSVEFAKAVASARHSPDGVRWD